MSDFHWICSICGSTTTNMECFNKHPEYERDALKAGVCELDTTDYEELIDERDALKRELRNFRATLEHLRRLLVVSEYRRALVLIDTKLAQLAELKLET